MLSGNDVGVQVQGSSKVDTPGCVNAWVINSLLTKPGAPTLADLCRDKILEGFIRTLGALYRAILVVLQLGCVVLDLRCSTILHG